MDITSFVASHREALLVGDYNAYRAQLSRQTLAARKRLGLATNKRDKFAPRRVTAEEIGGNHEYAQLMLLMAERAWAHAMHIKTSHTEDTSKRGITGSTRTHLLARLTKAAKTARDLATILHKEASAKASSKDVLESHAYAASLAGAEEFERQSGGKRSSDGDKSWQDCLRLYSEARVIYAALYEKEKKEMYRDILANTIDPTIRYAAYQAHLSRTIAIPTVARRYFPKGDTRLVDLVQQFDEWALKDKPAPQTEAEKQSSPREVPNSVTWRGRKANIVDASIGQALAGVAAAETRLKEHLSSKPNASNRDKAAAYDDILVASQDAADATKRATDELEKEKVDEGDARMQDLRVTSLAVNYDLVSWRVGRNRMLIGEDDGLTFEAQRQRKPKRPRKDGSEYPEREEGRGHKLARLRERVVLYDATIQSINSVKDLRGAMRDAKFVDELDSKASYFRALKCLNIAYSHSLLGHPINALALLQRAHDLASHAPPSPTASASDAPPTLDIRSSASSALQTHIFSSLSRTHALVEMRNLERDAATTASKTLTATAPLIQNLHTYPAPGTLVDLKNLVAYPPRIEPVPVKPLFLDVAWNYIGYPGRLKGQVVVEEERRKKPVVNGLAGEEQAPAERKRGWFGFGR